MTKRKKIEKIAQEVRRKAERYAKDRNLYPFYAGRLATFCGICSVAIHGELLKCGLVSSLVISDDAGHVWVECDGFIIDVTATQFLEKSPVHDGVIPKRFDEKVFIRPIGTYGHFDYQVKDKRCIESDQLIEEYPWATNDLEQHPKNYESLIESEI